MAEKFRLDVFIFQKGLVPSRSKATALIMEGKVSVNDKIITKSGFSVSENDNISIKETDEFVSRGGIKLKKALEEFAVNVKDKVCIDVGASTGGFTECLLRSGAKKVYCIDVGYGTLDSKLRNDLRVVNIEKTNIRYFDKNLLKEEIDIAVIDVSFISLEKVLPTVKELVKKNGEIIALLKPQFEAPRGSTKKGVVKDENVRQQTIEKIKLFSGSIGLKLINETDSPIKGPKGNLEYFLYLKV
ncbi:MAG: RNA methyltransferase [Elusimicrobia bacterium RIFOXYD2_FULL_34_15]|nr:MAG: RNA methyltransferase [Elusimicrobia bacterium RIFOXYD2_FULL_34_15]